MEENLSYISVTINNVPDDVLSELITHFFTLRRQYNLEELNIFTTNAIEEE